MLPPTTPEFREALDKSLNGVGRDKLFQGSYLRFGMPLCPGPDTRAFSVASMHRIKGLEFDHMCLADYDLLKIASQPAGRQTTQRCLLHVAATSTKNSLLVIAR